MLMVLLFVVCTKVATCMLRSIGIITRVDKSEEYNIILLFITSVGSI